MIKRNLKNLKFVCSKEPTLTTSDVEPGMVIKEVNHDDLILVIAKYENHFACVNVLSPYDHWQERKILQYDRFKEITLDDETYNYILDKATQRARDDIDGLEFFIQKLNGYYQ